MSKEGGLGEGKRDANIDKINGRGTEQTGTMSVVLEEPTLSPAWELQARDRVGVWRGDRAVEGFAVFVCEMLAYDEHVAQGGGNVPTALTWDNREASLR